MVLSWPMSTSKPDLVILYRDPHDAHDADQTKPVEKRLNYWKVPCNDTRGGGGGRILIETLAPDALGELSWHTATGVYSAVPPLLALFLLEATVTGIKPEFRGTTAILDLRAVVIPPPPV